MLKQRIQGFKASQHFRFLPLRSGCFVASLKYNTFLERQEKAGFKLKNLDTRRLMANRQGLGLLLTLRRLGRETYQRLSYRTETQYNLLFSDMPSLAGRTLSPGAVYRRSGKYQAYVGRVLTLRHLVTPFLTLGLNGGNYRSQIRPFAAYHYNRFDIFNLGPRTR